MLNYFGYVQSTDRTTEMGKDEKRKNSGIDNTSIKSNFSSILNSFRSWIPGTSVQ